MKLQIPSVQALLPKINPKLGFKDAQMARAILSFSLHKGGEDAESALDKVCKLCDESLDIRLYLKIFGIFLDCQKPWKIRQVTRFTKKRFIH